MESDLTNGEPTERTFCYPPLPDAATYIRLLQIDPGEDGDDIVCQLSVHPFSDVPSYFAVSYTWGEPLPKECIRINEIDLPVRRNCYYALSQIRRRNAGSYIWMDALCIAQNDVNEKNHQVEKMGEIYEMAEKVLVSLGPGSEDYACIAESLVNAPQAADGEGWTTWCNEIKSGGDGEKFSSLCKTVIAMGNNAYWKRVWIVQELFLARDIYLLFGNASIRWALLSFLLQTLNRYNVDSRGEFYAGLFRTPLKRLEEHKRWRLKQHDSAGDLDVILSSFGDNLCSDPLDRIYGFFHIIDWPERGDHRLSVDYRKSPFELAMDCLDYIIATEDVLRVVEAIKHAQTILKALKIDTTHPELRQFLERRYQSQHGCISTDRGTLLDSCICHQDQPDTPAHRRTIRPGPPLQALEYFMFPVFAEHFTQIRETANGALAGDFAWASDESERSNPISYYATGSATVSEIGAMRRKEVFIELNSLANDTLKLRALMHDDIVVALLCSAAQAGDYLLCLNSVVSCEDNPLNTCLVVRKYNKTIFEIIGQGLMSMDWSIRQGHAQDPSPETNQENTSRTRFDVHLSKDDLVALAALGLTPEENGDNFSSDTRIRRAVDQLKSVVFQRLHNRVTATRCSSYAVYQQDDNNSGEAQ